MAFYQPSKAGHLARRRRMREARILTGRSLTRRALIAFALARVLGY
jgi:hypothetical protein